MQPHSEAGVLTTAGMAAAQTPFTIDAMNAPVLFACILGVGLAALHRLSKLRDNDGEKLPRSWAAASLFVLSYIALYLFIVYVVVYWPDLIPKLLKAAGIESPQAEIPLLAVIGLNALLAVPQAKNVERRYGLFLHSLQYRASDEEALANYLATCPFAPSQHEIQLNEHYLHQFNLYIIDRDDSLLKLRSVAGWRKVNALLRRLTKAAQGGPGLLSEADIEEIRELEKAHQRKTALAVSIIRFLNNIRRDGLSPDAPASSEDVVRIREVSALLAAATDRDQQSIADTEELARRILEAGNGEQQNGSSHPLTLTEGQISRYLREIEGYFILEYEIILGKLSRLAAKSVVRAGDSADGRLQDLKAAGFTGLGRIEHVTMDRVIWALLAVWPLTLIIWRMMMYLSGRDKLDIIISIACSTSIAVLVGIVWGSRRSLVEIREVPWASYLVAGMIVMTGFILVNSVRYPLVHDATVQGYLTFMARIGVFALMPVLMTVTICRLARLERWPDWPLLHGWERLKDGFAVAMVMMLGFLSIMLLRTSAGEEALLTPERLIFLGGTALIGFAVGAIIVQDVRELAHSKLIDRSRSS